MLAANELKRNWIGIDNLELEIKTSIQKLASEKALFNIGADYEYLEEKIDTPKKSFSIA